MTALPDRSLARLLAQAAPRLTGASVPDAIALAVLLFLEDGDAQPMHLVDALGLPSRVVRDRIDDQVRRGRIRRVRKNVTHDVGAECVLSLTAKGARLLHTAYRHRRDA